MLLVFLLGSAKLAVDLIELIPAELVADVALLVALGSRAREVHRAGNRCSSARCRARARDAARALADIAAGDCAMPNRSA